MAVRKRSLIFLLHQYKADFNIKDNKGLTVFQVACKHSSIFSCKAILNIVYNANDEKELLYQFLKSLTVNQHYSELKDRLVLSMFEKFNKEILNNIRIKHNHIFQIVEDKNYPIALNFLNRHLVSDDVNDFIYNMKNPNMPDENDNYILHIYVKKGSIADILILLRYGADPMLIGNNYNTAFDLAIYNNRLDIVKILNENGLGLKAKESNINCPLNYACIFLNKDIIEYLITDGYDINKTEYGGNTPLYVLLSCFIESFNQDYDNLYSIINIFLDHEVNLDLPTNQNIYDILSDYGNIRSYLFGEM